MTETYTRFVKKYKDYFSRLKRQNSRQIMSHVTQISDHESEQLNRILHSCYVYHMLLYIQNHQTSLILYNVYSYFFSVKDKKERSCLLTFTYIFYRTVHTVMPNNKHFYHLGDRQNDALGCPCCFGMLWLPVFPLPPIVLVCCPKKYLGPGVRLRIMHTLPQTMTGFSAMPECFGG